MLVAWQKKPTFFVSITTANRARIFRNEADASLLIRVFLEARAQGNYELHAFAIMPEHVDFLMTPASGLSIEQAVDLVRDNFSLRYHPDRCVWDSSFTQRCIQDAADFQARLSYIESTPLPTGLCASPADFSFSSAREEFALDPPPEHFSPDRIESRTDTANRRQPSSTRDRIMGELLDVAPSATLEPQSTTLPSATLEPQKKP